MAGTFHETPVVVDRRAGVVGELILQQRGEHYEIICNGVFLMATYNGDSERALVLEALQMVINPPKRVFVGGLGVGFSLSEALADPRVQHVDVIEREPGIIAWNQEILSPFSDHALQDLRCTLMEYDLLEWLWDTELAKSQYDVIALDIDNGPDWTVNDGNLPLYSHKGLTAITELLHPGGVLAVWSSSRSPLFELRMCHHLQDVKVVDVQSHTKKGPPDVIYVGRRSMEEPL